VPWLKEGYTHTHTYTYIYIASIKGSHFEDGHHREDGRLTLTWTFEQKGAKTKGGWNWLMIRCNDDDGI